jgi:tRNA(adenine34) deaminase
MIDLTSDDRFMKEAFKEANLALEKNEVPVGAIVTHGKTIISRAHNQVELLKDPTAHAEMLAITSASNSLGTQRLTDCTIYITLEPCLMCAGAIFWSKIGRVVFGAYDNKKGFNNISSQILPKGVEVLGGVMEDECGTIVKNFFESKRLN